MKTYISLLAGTLAVSALLPGQDAATQRAAAPGGGIAWFGTWKQGAAEARRSGRPILLISAAPHCHSVSGIW